MSFDTGLYKAQPIQMHSLAETRTTANYIRPTVANSAAACTSLCSPSLHISSLRKATHDAESTGVAYLLPAASRRRWHRGPGLLCRLINCACLILLFCSHQKCDRVISKHSELQPSERECSSVTRICLCVTALV